MFEFGDGFAEGEDLVVEFGLDVFVLGFCLLVQFLLFYALALCA